jgi:sialidase-1
MTGNRQPPPGIRRGRRLDVWAPLRVLAAALILAAWPSLASAQTATEPRIVDVFVAGDGGYHTFRIPSVIMTAEGTLLAFAEGRTAAAADSGDIDIVLKRSRDGGMTWSALEVLGDNGHDSFSNPCPVIDPRTGQLLLLATRNIGTDREADIIAGRSKGSPRVWMMRSSDSGATWSRAEEITTSTKRTDWTWYAVGPGIGIQTSNGRIVIPANHAVAGSGIHRSHVILSDDGGRTWRIGGDSVDGTNESQVVQLADGRLMLNMRNHPSRPDGNFRMVATSRDGGESWTTAQPDRSLLEPPAQASILRLTRDGSDGRNRLLFSNPASTKRERMTVRLSYDEGSTWPISRVIHEGPAAYSMLVVLRDSRIGLLFERGDSNAYEKISFATFTLEWLSDGKDRLPPAAR